MCRRWACDFLAFSGHKMCGPTGIGVLWGRRELLEAMPPFLGGGSMIKTVTLHETTYADLPARFEAGTPAIGEAIALGEAVDYLQDVGLEAIHAHEQDLTAYALRASVRASPGLRIYGPPATERGGVLAFNARRRSIHTMSRRCSTAMVLRCGPDTTAASR